MNKFVFRSTLVLLIAAALAACGGGAGAGVPTQTPQIIIVENEEETQSAADEDEEDANQVETDDEAASGQADSTNSAQNQLEDLAQVCETYIVEQVFENGRMFWLPRPQANRCEQEPEFGPGRGEIWVIINDSADDSQGEWLSFVDNYDEDRDAETDPSIDAPTGLEQPIRGFGKIWRENLTDAQRDQLGFAVQEELGFVTPYRYEPDGYIDNDDQLVVRPGVHYVETLGGELFTFDEDSLTFTYEPAP